MTRPTNDIDARLDPGDADDEAIEIPGVWLFLPLPHPIPIPHGWSNDSPLGLAETLSATSPTFGVSSSLTIHQMEPGRDASVVDMAELYTFAAAVMAETDPPRFRDDPIEDEVVPHLNAAPLRGSRTIAEIAVPGLAGSDETELLIALDRAIEHIRLAQRAVAMATEWPVRLLARATLPPMIPTFRAVYRVPQDLTEPIRVDPESRTSIPWQIPGCAPPSALGIRPEPLDERRMDRFLHFGGQLSRSAAFTRYADLRREALVQRDHDGNYRMTLLALATAGEVLLDTALLHLLWEEHTTPSDAAGFFDRADGHTARVARNFPPRLGGAWEPNAYSPAGAYLRDVVRLRHRVVHTGHEPTREEL